MALWVPPDITPVCSAAHTNQTQCTSTGYMYLALLVQLFGNSTDMKISQEDSIDFTPELKSRTNDNDCESFDARPRYDNEGKKRKIYDYIIVGAGSAGSVLANRLSEDDDQEILLLEAGTEEPDITMVPALPTVLAGSSVDWKYQTQPQDTNCLAQISGSCVTPRGKTMGGSSAINYMVYMRGSKADYDGWAAEGNVGWTHDEVLPYFKKAENIKDTQSYDTEFHGIGGPLNVEKFEYQDKPSMLIIDAFKEKGFPNIDLSIDSKVGVDSHLSTSKDGKRQSTNVAYIRPIRNIRPNLHIMTNAFATKIIIDPETKTALGIEYHKNGDFDEAFASKEVIVSAGTYNSPKLLKLSGIGPKSELENLNIPVIADLKVGYNLQDHVTSNALVFTLSDEFSTLVNKDELFNAIYDYHAQNDTKHGPISSSTIFNSVAFFKTSQAREDAPNIQFHFESKNVKDFYGDPVSYTATKILPNSFYNGIAPIACLLTPKSRGFVALNITDPIFGPPVIYPGYLQEKEDRDALIEAYKFSITLEETETFKEAGAKFIRTPIEGCSDFEWGSYDYLNCTITRFTSTIFHPAGTCKMGPADDENAVVDPRLRVYGVQHLRVVDGSIMPKVIRGNTNAPIIMSAEKASDMIKEDRKNNELNL